MRTKYVWHQNGCCIVGAELEGKKVFSCISKKKSNSHTHMLVPHPENGEVKKHFAHCLQYSTGIRETTSNLPQVESSASAL